MTSEYLSANEEFRSTNEELESSKEELQSMNEELSTINSELNAKNEILAEASSDIKNFIGSTQIATLFLDNDLRIENFTPALSEIFHVRAGDRGRPITDIATRLSYGDLKGDAEKVMRSLSMVEHQVEIAQDGSVLDAVRPYRTLNGVINRVVITFVDITERKHYEEALARLAAIVASSTDAIISNDRNGIIVSWNIAAEQLFRYTADEVISKPIMILYSPDRVDEASEILDRVRRGERVDHYEPVCRRKDGGLVDVSITVSPIKDGRGEIVGVSKIAQDITVRKDADALRELMADELNHRVKNTLATVQSIAAQSLKGAMDGQGREAFDARLVALSRTHDLLAHDNWEGVSLSELLLQELEPYRSEEGLCFVIEGPDLGLPPKAALALGMAFHELATNAAKYGLCQSLKDRYALHGSF